MLKPGQKGIEDLLARYGPSLLCVRYRYDEHSNQRVKHVELVVQRFSRPHRAKSLGESIDYADGATPRIVALRIGWRERDS
jgi:hypothetical protein